MIKLFFWPQFKKNTSTTKDSVNPFFKREKKTLKISLTSKRQCSYNKSLLYIPRVADRIKYSARVQWLKTSEVTDTIWWKIELSFFFVTVRPSLTNACDLAVLNVADINVFYTAQRTICYDEFKEKDFFLCCWQWKLFIQIISCQQSFFASDKMKTTSFLVFNWIRAIYENFQERWNVMAKRSSVSHAHIALNYKIYENYN